MARLMVGSVAAATMAWGEPAKADVPCARVQPAPELSAAWAPAVQELTRQIAQLPASDCQPMTLTVTPTVDGKDPAARVVAEALDGRRTERVVRHPESLVATALGLVMAIPPGPPAPTLAPSLSPSLAPARALEVEPIHPPIAVWVGFEAGGRLAQPTSIAMVDLALDGVVVLDHWLLSAAVRNTPLGLVSSQGLDRDAFRQIMVAMGVGRRLAVGDAVLDVILEPAVTAMRMEYDFSTKTESVGEDVELSLDGVVRMALPVSKGWALTLTLEADILPGNLGSEPARIAIPAGETAQPPPFPSFQAALRVGAMGALL